MSEASVSSESVTDIIKKFQKYPSIIKIKNKEKTLMTFYFFSC